MHAAGFESECGHRIRVWAAVRSRQHFVEHRAKLDLQFLGAGDKRNDLPALAAHTAPQSNA